MAQFTTPGVTSVELDGCKFWGWFDDMDHVLVCVSVHVYVCVCVCRLTDRDYCDVNDAGLKAFSAALGCSSTITTVKLGCKYDWVVCWNRPCVVACARVCVRAECGFSSV